MTRALVTIAVAAVAATVTIVQPAGRASSVRVLVQTELGDFALEIG